MTARRAIIFKKIPQAALCATKNWSMPKLELHKCGFHLIFYDFDKDGIPSMMRTISNLVITLENEKGEDIEIRTKKVYTLHSPIRSSLIPARYWGVSRDLITFLQDCLNSFSKFQK